MKYSGFTFVHNALRVGMPIREAIKAVQPFVEEIVAVDMESTDGTRQVLEDLGCRVIDGKWGDEAGKTLAASHALHTECKHDAIIHFEADEVWDPKLLRAVTQSQSRNTLVYRLQVEQNFQRCRWYPEPVHRVFIRGAVEKTGHTTNWHKQVRNTIPPRNGYIWDCANMFRDQWCARIEQQAELWGESPNFLRHTRRHFLLPQPIETSDEDLRAFLGQAHWTWDATHFNIPKILQPLVGKVKYE